MLPQMAPMLWLSLFIIIIFILHILSLFLLNVLIVKNFSKMNVSETFFNFWSF